MEDVMAVREVYRQEQWMGTIRECQRSGLNNREFCQRNGISEKSYYYWLRKLRTAAMEQKPEIVKLGDTKSNETLEISFKGARLTLPASVDMEAVAAVLRSIQGNA